MPLPLLGLSLHGLGGGVAVHGLAAGAAATAGVATAAGGTSAVLNKSSKQVDTADATVIGGSDMLVCTQGLEAPVPLPGARPYWA